MAFIDRISDDLTAAMRSRDQLKLGALRMAKAALMNREVERGRPLDDAESLQVIASLIKQRRDSFEQFDKAGRRDLADKEQAEIANQYVRKGTQIMVVGTVEVSAYLDKNNQPAASLELTADTFQLLGSRGDREGGQYDDFAPPQENVSDIPF